MKKLPTLAKWLVLALAFAAIFGLMYLVNERSAEVKMPAPENWFGAGPSSSIQSSAVQG